MMPAPRRAPRLFQRGADQGLVHGAVKWVFKGVAALAVVVLVAGALLALRLSQGPLPLDLLTPYLMDEINRPEALVRYTLGGAELRWGDLEQPFDLRLRDVQARARDGALIAAVPDASLTVAPLPLVAEGRLEVEAVTLRGAVVNLRRERDGSVVLAMEGDAAEAEAFGHRAPGAAAAIRAVMEATGIGAAGPGGAAPAVAAGVPERVRVADARVALDDRLTGFTWVLPHVDLALARREGKLTAEASATLATPQGGASTLDAVATLDAAGAIDAGLTLRDVRPADFATVAEPLAPLAGIDLPLSGTATATLSLDGDRLAFDLFGLSLTSGAGIVALPAPVAHAWSLDKVEVRVSAADDLSQVAVERLLLDFEGPTAVTLMGGLDRGPDQVGVTVEATAAEVAVDGLPELWPAGIEGKTREWIDRRLENGRVPAFTVRASLAGPDLETLDLVDLSGEGRAEGVTVHYMPPMPPVVDAAATMSVSPQTFGLAVEGGRLDDLRVTGGHVDFTDLDVSPQNADIDLTIEGPLRDALRVVDSEPLGYVSRYGLPIDGVQGVSVTRLRVAFPLLDALELDDVEVRADSTVRGAVLPDAAFDETLSDGDLTLAVDKRSMEVSGTAALAEIPATVLWRENFTDGVEFRSRYEATATLDAAARERLDLDIVPFTEPFITGPAAASVMLTELSDGRRTLGATIDLTPSTMRLPGFGWSKAPGASGQATLSVLMDGDGKVSGLPRFSVSAAGGLSATGRVEFAAPNEVSRAVFTSARIGETDMQGSIAPRPDGGLDIDVSGPALDAVPFLADEEAPEAVAVGEEAEAGSMPPMSLRASFDVVWLAEDATLESVTAHLIHDGSDWRYMDIGALAEAAAPVSFQLRPLQEDGPERAFTLAAGDAGTLLRGAGLLDTMQGGTLSVEGTIDVNGAVAGLAEITQFRLMDAPVLARILSVAALTGILEGLTGDGLAFTAATAPFTHADGTLRLSDARVYGPSLGLTASGAVTLSEPETVDLQGTIVPIYSVNSLLGKVPVLGDLITGGEEGGGLFAANYAVTGPLTAPTVTVNPLSVLAPGFLRNLFQAKGPEPEAAPAE